VGSRKVDVLVKAKPFGGLRPALTRPRTLLAYLVHTALDWANQPWRSVRAKLPSRRTFFEHLRSLLQYVIFEHWDQLIAFMLDGLTPAPKQPRTG
jgi:hypothetical protein